MATVITDKTDIKSIEKILSDFNETDQVDIYSSKISPIEMAIVFNDLKISNVVIQKENNLVLFILNNSTIIQRQISQIEGLDQLSEKELNTFQNMGNGVFWEEPSGSEVSLKSLIKEELEQKYRLQIA